MDPNQQGQSNAGAPSAPNSGANAPATGASTPSAGTPPPVFSGAGAQVSGASVTPGPTAPATPTATPAGSSTRRFFGASNRPGSAASAGQPASGIYSGNPTPGIITSAPAASGAAGGKKLSKGMIVGLIVIAILAIAAVVVGVIAATGGNRSSESESSQSAPVNMFELKTAYNNLANYIAFGDENTSEKKLEDGKTYSTYDVLSFASSNHIAMSILEADKKLDEGASVEKTDYFSKLNQLYQQLPNGLYENYDVAISNIGNYYQGFSSINVITLEDILSRYNVEGLELARTYINNATTSDSEKEYVRTYASYLTEYDLAFLNLVNDVKINQGCTINLNNLNTCNLSAAASYEAFVSAQNNIQIGDAYKLRSEYQKLAVDALLGIHKVIYGSGEGATE